ncbi:hypothetical protein ABIA32_000979 [Streptacidiphilus sp. MAP12-20]
MFDRLTAVLQRAAQSAAAPLLTAALGSPADLAAAARFGRS